MPPLQFISKLSSHIAMSHTGNPQTSLDTRQVNELQLLLVLLSITAVMHMHNSTVHTVYIYIHASLNEVCILTVAGSHRRYV